MSSHIYNIIMVAGALAALATSSFADVVVSDDGLRFHYLPNSREAQLTFLAPDSTNASLYQGELLVPSSVDVQGADGSQTLRVEGLSAYACVCCDALTGVVLPEGLTSIGYSALADCPALQSVTLPSSLATLGDWAFYRDASLRQVSIPSATHRVGACSFGFCAGLDSVGLSQGLGSIAHCAFYHCASLTTLRLPWTLSQIDQYAFAFCSQLQRIEVEGLPVAITPDVFEGVDISRCTLVVPTDQLEAYSEAEVWQDFIIEDGGYLSIDQVEADAPVALFDYRVEADALVITTGGDAPALLYNLSGHRLAVVPSHSTAFRVPVPPGIYVIRCGKAVTKIEKR